MEYRPLHPLTYMSNTNTPATDQYENLVKDEANRAMRGASGRIDDDRLLVEFLYTLGRDHLPLGDIEDIMEVLANGNPTMYTNGWLAEWAQYTADRLTE